MGDRRKQQNYKAFFHYLTDGVWTNLQSGRDEKATSSLFQHLWLLGLRCPNEATFSVIFNVITMSRASSRQMSSFERYTYLTELKQSWKKYKQARKPDDFQYFQYMETLPPDVGDLPSEYYLDAFAEGGPVPARARNCSSTFLFGSVEFEVLNIWWSVYIYLVYIFSNTCRLGSG